MNILITNSIGQEGAKILEESEFIVDIKTDLRERLREEIGAYDALIVRSGTKE